jgi:[acyl-carrier-protein] S-malonyltransferase
MFTGQGSQYVGMGKDLAKEWEVARQVFEDANDALRFELSQTMFEGPDSKLLPTAIAQPAIIAHAMAILAVLRVSYTIHFDGHCSAFPCLTRFFLNFVLPRKSLVTILSPAHASS